MAGITLTHISRYRGNDYKPEGEFRVLMLTFAVHLRFALGDVMEE